MRELTEAIRQFKHNDGSEGFVIGYDVDVIDSIVNDVAVKLDHLIKVNADIVAKYNDLRGKAFYTNNAYKKCIEECEMVRNTMEKTKLLSNYCVSIDEASK